MSPIFQNALRRNASTPVHTDPATAVACSISLISSMNRTLDHDTDNPENRQFGQATRVHQNLWHRAPVVWITGPAMGCRSPRPLVGGNQLPQPRRQLGAVQVAVPPRARSPTVTPAAVAGRSTATPVPPRGAVRRPHRHRAALSRSEIPEDPLRPIANRRHSRILAGAALLCPRGSTHRRRVIRRPSHRHLSPTSGCRPIAAGRRTRIARRTAERPA